MRPQKKKKIIKKHTCDMVILVLQEKNCKGFILFYDFLTESIQQLPVIP